MAPDGDGGIGSGVSRRGVFALIDDGTLVRLSRMVVVGACLVKRAASDRALGHRIRVERLLLEYDDIVASHESAAFLDRLPLLERPSLAIGTRPRGAWRGGDWSRVRIAPLPEHHLTVIDGLRTTAVARTVVDVARTLSMREAVVVGDAAIRRGLSGAELWDMVGEMRGWADLGRATRSIDFLDGRSESVLESVSRVIFHEYGLEPPEPQAWLEGSDGVMYRSDFWWKKYGLIGEADGLMKYDGEDAENRALGAEKLRQEALEEPGRHVVRWTFRQMLWDTDRTIGRLTKWMR